MDKYAKFIVALIGALIALATALAGDGWLGDYGPVVISFLTAAAVYFKANQPADAP